MLVVGRGVFGLGAAESLARLRHEVVVLGGPNPRGSSEAASRIIRDDYPDGFHRRWASEAMGVWARWSEDAEHPLFHRTGLANLAASPWDDDPYLSVTFGEVDGAVRMDARDVDAAFPFLHPGRFPSGYRNPRAGWVAASDAVRHMELRCSNAGVDFIGEDVAAVGDGWIGLTGDGLLRADQVVVAAGVWTPGLVPAAPLVVSGQPVVFFRPADPSPYTGIPVMALGLATTGFYCFPAGADGTVKVAHHGPGITHDPGMEHVPPMVVERFRRFLTGAVPSLAQAPVVSTRVCFYSDAPDGRFLIDRVPGMDRLVVASGGSGHGFKFAPVIGDVIAAVVTDTDHPRRSAFEWRAPAPIGDAARAGPLENPD